MSVILSYLDSESWPVAMLVLAGLHVIALEQWPRVRRLVKLARDAWPVSRPVNDRGPW